MRPHLATLVEDWERNGSGMAIVRYKGNRRVTTTYAELRIVTGRFSRLLEDRGIGPGERVLLWGRNSAEWMAAFFGCVLRGVLVVPLDAAGGAEFAGRVTAEVSPRLIVGDTALLRKLPEGAPRMAFVDFPQALPAEPLLAPEAALGRETPLQILYTSGTTSAPKGIVHTHGNVLASLEAIEGEIARYRRHQRWVHPLGILHTLPLSHVFGQFLGLWVPPLLGAVVHFDDRLVAEALIERIRRGRIHVAAVVPRVLELLRAALLGQIPELAARMAKVQGRKLWRRWWRMRDVHGRFGWRFLGFVCGGATLPVEVEEFWSVLGFVLIEGYGMTETTALATLNHPFHRVRGSIGKPLAGREVRLAGDGEILVRGPMLAAGTWQGGHMEPRAGEWLHTGDLGALDPSGALRFLGRKSDVIVTAAGINLHPADLEQAVRDQPGVRDAMVVSWAGARGALPIAVVILGPGEAEGREPRGIIAAANRRLAESQQIAHALAWPGSEFPRNSTGKPLRQEVAAWVAATMEGRGGGGRAHSDPLLRLLEEETGQSVTEVEDTAALPELGLDSLGRMHLAAAIEEQFGVSVSDEVMAGAKTLGDLRRLVAGPVPRAQGLDGRSAAPLEHRVQRQGSAACASAPRYPRWPWNPLVRALRILFLEIILRPLVWLLAHPRIGVEPALLPAEPAIYVANHVTAFDTALVLYALPGPIRRQVAIAMSAEILAAWESGRPATGLGLGSLRWPGSLRWLGPIEAGLVTALFNVFPLPTGAGLRQSFAHAGEALDRGYNLLIFPEGRRTTNGELGPFQAGIGLLAEESNAVAVPVALAGLWQAGQRRLRPPGLAVRVDQPLRRGTDETPEEFSHRLRAAVEHLIRMKEEA